MSVANVSAAIAFVRLRDEGRQVMSQPSTGRIKAALDILQQVITKMVQETGCEPAKCLDALTKCKGDRARAVAWLVDPVEGEVKP